MKILKTICQLESEGQEADRTERLQWGEDRRRQGLTCTGGSRVGKKEMFKSVVVSFSSHGI